MATTIAHYNLTPTIALTECSDGWWLYDKTRGMNLAMKAKTEREAFVSALTYYQNRLHLVEKQHSDLRFRVDSFIEQFEDDCDGQ